MLFAFNPIQPIVDASDAVLRFWHGLLGDFDGSWGVSIILLTFTVRLFILPLTFKGVKSMQRLQLLQPEIKKLQARYKDDTQRLNQEIMAFYQREKVTHPVLLGALIGHYLGTQLAASAVTMVRADPMQRRIMLALPFVFVVFS